MTTPIRSVPDSVSRWISFKGWLRWVDAAVAWVCLWIALRLTPERAIASRAGVLSLALLGLAAMIRLLRSRWRPVSGWVSLAMSRELRAGDYAWYVGTNEADVVLVTARHRARLVIVRPDLAHSEGLKVRRTRVLLIPVERHEIK